MQISWHNRTQQRVFDFFPIESKVGEISPNTTTSRGEKQLDAQHFINVIDHKLRQFKNLGIVWAHKASINACLWPWILKTVKWRENRWTKIIFLDVSKSTCDDDLIKLRFLFHWFVFVLSFMLIKFSSSLFNEYWTSLGLLFAVFSR